MRRNAATTALTMTAAAALLALAGGCGQGKFTGAHKSAAEEKLSLIKSGTEWNMAHQQFMAGDLDKALRSVDQSIALNDRVPKSHVLRGRILMEKGRLEEARGSLLEAEKLDPTSAEPQYYLGIIHERFNQPEEALARYRKASACEPGNAQFVVASAEMLIYMDRLDEAESLLSERRGDFQYNAAICQSLGQIKTIRGEHELAARYFDEARLLAPDDNAIVEDLARSQIACGRFAEAEYHLGRLIEADKDQTRRDLMHLRARCLVKLDRPVEARSILQTLTGGAEGAGDLEAWVMLGNVAATLNDSGRLRTASQRVIALAPNAYEGHFLKALHLRRQGDSSAALASAETAAKLSTVDPGPQILRALIQQDLGRRADARKSLLAALKLDPKNASARQLMDTLDSRPAVATHPAAAE